MGKNDTFYFLKVELGIGYQGSSVRYRDTSDQQHRVNDQRR